MRGQAGERLTIPTRGILRFRGVPRTLELRCDPVRRRWYAHQIVEVSPPDRKEKPPKCAAIDLGARVLAALATEGLDHQLLFFAREVWKDFLYWMKQIAKEQARLAKAGRRTSRALRRLCQTRTRNLRHTFTALAAEIARILKRHRVTVLFLEDLTDIREDMDFGPRNFLVHNFWAFRMLRKLIEAECSRAGIAVTPSCPTARRPPAPSVEPRSPGPSATARSAPPAGVPGTRTPTRQLSCSRFGAPRRGTGRRPRPRGRKPSGGSAASNLLPVRPTGRRAATGRRPNRRKESPGLQPWGGSQAQRASRRPRPARMLPQAPGFSHEVLDTTPTPLWRLNQEDSVSLASGSISRNDTPTSGHAGLQP